VGHWLDEGNQRGSGSKKKNLEERCEIIYTKKEPQHKGRREEKGFDSWGRGSTKSELSKGKTLIQKF